MALESFRNTSRHIQQRILIGIPNERAADLSQYASKEFHSPRHSWEYKWLKIFVAPIECVQLSAGMSEGLKIGEGG